jgi:hypothetical protein
MGTTGLNCSVQASLERGIAALSNPRPSYEEVTGE